MRPQTLVGTASALILAALLLSMGLATSHTDAREGHAAANRYIGAAKCKNCHKAPESGDQYGTWEKQKHAHAFETLGTDAAKELAKAQGIADPQTADECIRCHMTGHGLPAEQLKKGFDPKAGVQCETCHGPGEEHMKQRVIAAAKGAPAEEYTKLPEGEVISVPPREICVACHNKQSPSYKPFCYYKRVAEIRHLNPKKPRTQEELDNMLVCNCDQCGTHDCDESCAVPAKDIKK